jgi:hypothetical protein
MSDLEIVTACAKAMGLTPLDRCDEYGDNCYDPLTDDAQNAALDDVLLKRGWYQMSDVGFSFSLYDSLDQDYVLQADMTIAANRRRARCECVAKLEGV